MANYCVYSGGSGASGAVAGSVPTSGEWAAAYTSITSCLAGITEADGDIIFVANDHSHNAGGAITWTFSHTSGLVRVISIDRSNTTTATPLAGATETTGGNTAFTITPGFAVYVFGMTCTAGAGGAAGSASITVGNAAADGSLVFDKCTFYRNNTSTTNFVVTGGTAAQQWTRFLNCTWTNGAVGQVWALNAGGPIEFVNPTLGGTAPTTVMQALTRAGPVTVSGADFSAATNLINVASDDSPSVFRLNNCKLPTNIVTGTHLGTGSHIIEVTACSTGDNSYEYYYQDGHGIITHDSGIYLTSGGLTLTDTDGASVAVSQKFVPSSTYVSKAWPLNGPWSYAWVSTTGAKTISAKIAYDNATALKDTECWLEVEYMGGAAALNCPQSQIATTAPVVSGTLSRDIIAAGSNLSNTSEAWTGTGGWANKKTATLSASATVDEIGLIRVRCCVGANQTVYFDPVVTVA